MTIVTRRWKFGGFGRGPASKTLELTTGFYTPTLTNVANLSASTAARLRFQRLGDIVTVFGKVTVDCVSAGVLTRLGISLPIASNLTDAGDCGGSAHMTAIQGDSAGIIGDETDNRAELSFVACQPSEQVMTVHFQYVVLV